MKGDEEEPIIIHQDQNTTSTKPTTPNLKSSPLRRSTPTTITHTHRKPENLSTILDAEENEEDEAIALTTNDSSTSICGGEIGWESEESGRDRLKRHRGEVAGQVWIPDIWGQEDLLKDWIDCSAFDSALVPSGILSARAALAEEGRRSVMNSGSVRLNNSC